MNQEIVPIHRKESLREDGMLFVRTEGILETMVNTPLIIAGLMLVALTIPIQTSFGSTRALDLTLYSDGSAHVSAKLDVDTLEPDFEVSLFGPSVDNFVAVGENGFLLSSEIIGDKVTVHTFGSSTITIDYDIHDLISKDGRVWSFSLDAPTDYSLLMPANSIIVGMSTLPSNMALINDQIKLELDTGLSEITYILSTSNPPANPQINPEQPTSDISTITLIGALVATAVAGVVILMKRKQTKSETKIDPLDPETIFSLRPELREDDKDYIKFISKNGGQALESELRKKFLQPRTTMWRAVKRLERQGIIEISKKDLQNLIKLKKELEEEE